MASPPPRFSPYSPSSSFLPLQLCSSSFFTLTHTHTSLFFPPILRTTSSPTLLLFQSRRAEPASAAHAEKQGHVEFMPVFAAIISEELGLCRITSDYTTTERRTEKSPPTPPTLPSHISIFSTPPPLPPTLQLPIPLSCGRFWILHPERPDEVDVPFKFQGEV